MGLRFPKAFPRASENFPRSSKRVAAPDTEAHFCLSFPCAALGLGHFRGASGKMGVGSWPPLWTVPGGGTEVEEQSLSVEGGKGPTEGLHQP